MLKPAPPTRRPHALSAVRKPPDESREVRLRITVSANDARPACSPRTRALSPEPTPPTPPVPRQVWDGDMPLMPQVILEDVSTHLLFFDPDSDAPKHAAAATAEAARQQLARVGTAAAGAIAAAASRARAEAQAAPEPAPIERDDLLMHRVREHPNYRKARRFCDVRRKKLVSAVPPDLKLRKRPRFFFIGKDLRRLGVQRVHELLTMDPAHSTGWDECMLDLALNTDADEHLQSLCYSTSLKFVVRVESAEVSYPVVKDAPFGLAPCMYVRLEHGSCVRISPVARDTRTPSFEWLSGAMHFEPDEPLKIQLLFVHSPDLEVDPKKDLLVGQAWLQAPVLPRPKKERYPAIFAIPLGDNVGYVHLSIVGPSLRRSYVRGCALPGTSVRVPACSILCARGLSSAWSCLRSDECKRASAALCCCFVVVGSMLAARAGGAALTGGPGRALSSMMAMS